MVEDAPSRTIDDPVSLTALSLLVPNWLQYVQQGYLFYEIHASSSAGHSGFFKMYDREQCNFFWQGLKMTIQQMVADDDTFQVNEGETKLLSGLLKPLPIPTQLWPTISMDFLAALWWYNTTSQRTPYEAVYGKTLPFLLPYTLSSSPVQEIDSVLRNRDQILLILQDNLHMARIRLQQQADHYRLERTFHVADMVLLRL